MDADHVPGENYLEEMIRPFIDEKVGYVSAPSICDLNASESWTAREGCIRKQLCMAAAGRIFQWLCPAVHRVTLCRANQGIERNRRIRPRAGRRSFHNPDDERLRMERHSCDQCRSSWEGPPDIAACITQEFQWSRSLMILLLTELPKYWKRLPLKLKVLFLFSELWYPVFSLMFLLGTFLPVIAVITGNPWITVSFIDFLLYSIPVNLATLAIVWFLKMNGWFRPSNAPVISWEIALFQLFRWPWALFGSIMGIVVTVKKKTPGFKVTPKGKWTARS